MATRRTSPARRQPIRSQATQPPRSQAIKPSTVQLYLGYAWPLKDELRITFARDGIVPKLLLMLTSHDLVDRDEQAVTFASEARRLHKFYQQKQLKTGWLYIAFYYSSFTYSFIGLAMLLHFNRHLPEAFWQAAVINVDLYALILVIQGLLSFWADVVARTALCVPQHMAYLLDRASAAPMTALTLYLGIVCWHEPSSRIGRSLAATSAVGLVPVIGSQLALRRGDLSRFMQLHIAWHCSIPLVAYLWLGHTCHGWFGP